jgi:hypothetical protein
MNQSEATEQFAREVFPAELAEINERRRQLGLAEVPVDATPSAKFGLVGLAISGGGIRSATFALGVVQALARHGLLKKVDYQSTVSGGGFLGSCLSSLLNDKSTGPDQERFPLRYEVGTKEPLAVGHLRQGARYLAPGGLLDKLRIPAVMLRGVISNMLIFLFLILLLVALTEFVYEFGTRLRLPFTYIALTGVAAFLVLVVLSPFLSRILHLRSNWARRNLEEMTFTLALLVMLTILVIVPSLILAGQLLDVSWVDMKDGITANLLRPFEPRDYLQWLLVLLAIVMFTLAGRASRNVARLGGKIMLISLGLIGPAFLFLIFFALLALQIDSPFLTPKELFRLDSTNANELSEMGRITPELRHEFRGNRVRVGTAAEVITLEKDLRWLLHDGDRGYMLRSEQDGVIVYPDYQYTLNRGSIPSELRTVLARKGYRLGTQAVSVPQLRDNRYSIVGSRFFWLTHDPKKSTWTVEQVVSNAILSEALQAISYTIQISDAPMDVLLHEGVTLSDDDIAQAVRFVEEGSPHDVVLLVDNSVPPFADKDEFLAEFKDALDRALTSFRPTVKVSVFWFDEHVHRASNLEAITPETKHELVQSLFAGVPANNRRLNFEGKQSNSPAALARAMIELSEYGRKGKRKSIAIISDGVIDLGTGHDQGLQSWIEGEFAEDAQAAGIRVYGVALSAKANFVLFANLARKTGGAFYPAFESSTGDKFNDIFEAMEQVKAAAGSHLVSPFQKVTVTDANTGIQYDLTRAENGIRIRATLRDPDLTPDNISGEEGRWRRELSDFGIELSGNAAITRINESRWEVHDPFDYTIQRNGRRLMVSQGGGNRESESGLAESDIRSIPESLWDKRTDWVLLLVFFVLLVYWLFVDINRTSGHGFYRDRLSKAYLVRVNSSGAVEHHDNQRLSGLNLEGTAAPYHLINVALNLQGSKHPSLRGRPFEFFFFSKRFSGSNRTGYARTEDIERYDENLDLGTAMAISGAAAAPNAGQVTKKSLVFILTLLNVRLGYWLPNPRFAERPPRLRRLALLRGPGPKYMLNEALGKLDMQGTFVNVSDGGHIENLGIFELLRRRCRFIFAIVGERDSEMTFGGLVRLMLYARIDLGIEIKIDLDPLRKDDAALSSKQWAVGTIHYADGETGHLLYIKSSLAGDEYEYIRKYRSENPMFPHETTAEQFFTEARFEAYRGLGYHIGSKLFSNDDEMGDLRSLKDPLPLPT